MKPNGALSNSLETKVNSRQRFFGDTIRVIKAIPKPGPQLPGSRSQLARKAPVTSLKLNSTETKNSNAKDSASVSQSIEKICPEGTPRVKSWHRPSNLQSTISNSIFFDEDDSSQSSNQGNHQVHSANATQIAEEYRINEVNKGKFKSTENHIDLSSSHVRYVLLQTIAIDFGQLSLIIECFFPEGSRLVKVMCLRWFCTCLRVATSA